MPLRRPGTAASAVAAMAGDHGSRSSRPRLKKPKKTRNKMLGEIEGGRGVLTAGKEGDIEARRRWSVQGRAADFRRPSGLRLKLPRARVKEKNGAWRQQGGAETGSVPI